MTSAPVRTRVAPSPTGDPHVGTAYQALFNAAFAQGRGGRFLLRIEDTDRARSTPESERVILESLRWLGITWDEGPDVGGPFGPYRQSERLSIYREHADRLLAGGHAYRCFCTRERLDGLRREGKGGYDRACRDLDPVAGRKRAQAGEPHVVRMKVPVEGSCRFRDLLRGEIVKDWESIDDQVILKSDGYPTYHLAVVVDDHLMEITHVIRGEEWINSVPKHVRLYEYFGWDLPVFCHLPLLRNNDKNRSKLSKRKNPTSIAYYRRAGYLPEALLNFLGMMGWTMPDGEEKFGFDDMSRNLELERISLGGPIFDVDKLRWLNGRYLRENYTPETLLAALKGWAMGDDDLLRIVPLVQPRLETLGDWGTLTAPFFSDRVPLDPALLVFKGKSPEESAGILQMAVWRLEGVREFSAPALEETLKELAAKLDLKLRDLTVPFYAALSGSTVWTPLYDSMAILGSDMVRVRLRRGIEALGGLSEKKLKEWERTYGGLFASGGEPA
jgi:glutamyl-tRNA synthetase